MGDDRTINFWTDIWLPPRPLIDHSIPSAVIDISAKVHNFWDRNGWNMDSLYSCLPDHIVAQIVHVPSGFNGCGANV